MIVFCLWFIVKECMRKVVEEERKLKGLNDFVGIEFVNCGVFWDEIW